MPQGLPSNNSSSGSSGSSGNEAPPRRIGSRPSGTGSGIELAAQLAASMHILLMQKQEAPARHSEAISKSPKAVGEVRQLQAQHGAINAHLFQISCTKWLTATVEQ